tara:strand:- start:2551 stop:3078 length:528 start_codon:yes stop_codon:yes gene_type:complete
MIPVHIIVALDQSNGIGKDNQIPWHLPADLKYFKDITSTVSNPSLKNVVIMGRKTWDSIPDKYKPLSSRINVVISRQQDKVLPDGVRLKHSLTEAIDSSRNDSVESIFIIGGGQLYKEAMALGLCKTLYITKVLDSFECDTFFPEYKSLYQEISTSQDYVNDKFKYSFKIFRKVT